MRDMCIIVRESGSPFTIHAVRSVEHHTGIRPNLWPESDEELTNAEKAARDEFQGTYQEFADMIRKNMERHAEHHHLEDEAAFIEGGPFPDQPPAFVEMMPEDEASIRGEAA